VIEDYAVLFAGAMVMPGVTSGAAPWSWRARW
jgi:hypothetical protein